MRVKASINLKINLIIIISLLLLGIIAIFTSSVAFKKRGAEEIANYSKAIMEEKKEMLKYLVASAHNIATNNYAESHDIESLKSAYGEVIKSAVTQAFSVL